MNATTNAVDVHQVANDLAMRILLRAELTKAVARYARKHGYSASTVRTCTALKIEAVREWRSR